MLSMFWLFFFGIAAVMAWKNYSEDETIGRMILASALTIGALLLGLPAILGGAQVIIIALVAFCALGIIGAVYERSFHGVDRWDEDIDIGEFEIVIDLDGEEYDDDEEPLPEEDDESDEKKDDDIPF